MWHHFFPLLFPKDSESLKILDSRLREVGAKRPLNGTSKSEQTDRHTNTRTNRLIESIGPNGRCFEKKKKIVIPDTGHPTPDTWHLTPDTWHLTRDMRHLTFTQKFSFLALSVRAGKWFEDLEEKDPSVNQSVTEVFVEQPRLHRVC